MFKKLKNIDGFKIMFTLDWSLWLSDSDSWFNFSCHDSKGFFYIFAIFSWGLKELHIVVFSKLLSLIGWNLSWVFHIWLVSDQHSWNIVWCMLLYLIHPIFNGTETFSISQIISDNNSMSSFIVATCDCFKSFLSCSVPLSKNWLKTKYIF